jgi:hypothetical protein
MIKKALLAAIATGALSVPLAGMAWAEPPSDPGSHENAIGQGGVPTKLGTFVDSGITGKVAGTPSLNPGGGPTPPGKVFISGAAKAPGPTPDAMGQLESQIWSAYTLADGTEIPSKLEEWGNITPGLALKPLTPGCDKGRSAVPAVPGSDPVKCVG